MPFQGIELVAIGKSDGQLWHTLRNSDGGWQSSFGSIEGQSKGGPKVPPGFQSVGAGSADGATFQVVGIEAIGGTMWHTLRKQDGTWQSGMSPVQGQSAGPAHFDSVACAGANGLLHVVGISDGSLWHTYRASDAAGTWQKTFGPIAKASVGGPSFFAAVALATDDGKTLHVVGLGQKNDLWHTARFPNGTWQANFEQIGAASPQGPPQGFSLVTCGGTGGMLFVIALGSDGQLWHISRQPSGVWQTSFEKVPSTGGPSGGSLITSISCANLDTSGLCVFVTDYNAQNGIYFTSVTGPGWSESFGHVSSAGQPMSAVASARGGSPGGGQTAGQGAGSFQMVNATGSDTFTVWLTDQATGQYSGKVLSPGSSSEVAQLAPGHAYWFSAISWAKVQEYNQQFGTSIDPSDYTIAGTANFQRVSGAVVGATNGPPVVVPIQDG